MIEKLIHKSLNSLLSFLLLVVSSIFLLSASAEIKVPSPTSYKYLNDYVHIASETEVNGILSIGKELEDKTGAQAVVVIINSTNNVPIEDYANTLFRSWGIGEKVKITAYWFFWR